MIRIGIVGTGAMAGQHAEKFGKIRGCRLEAACDVDEGRLAAFCDAHGIPGRYASLEAMLAGRELDAVSIVTPDPYHEPAALEAIAAGKHVLCEKPLALDRAGALRTTRAAEEARVVNMVNFSYRNAAVVQQARRWAEQGKLGRIVHVDAAYFQSWLVSKSYGDWRTTPRLAWRLSSRHGSKGALGDIGIHAVDLAMFTAGPIRGVNAHLKAFPEAKGRRHGEFRLDANDSALIHAEFANGALGTIQATRWAVGHVNTIRLCLYGTEGALRFDLARSSEEMEVSRGGDIDAGRWRTVRCPRTPTNYQRFARAIATGVPGQPDFRCGSAVQAVLDACFASDRRKGRVRVP